MKEERQNDENQSSLEDYFGADEEPEVESEPQANPPQEPSSEQASSEPSNSEITNENEYEEPEEMIIDMKVGERETPNDLPPSMLLSIDYSGPLNKAILKLYEPKSKKIYFWIDNTGHKPYLYTDWPPQMVESKVKRNPGFVKTETVQLHDLLHDKPVTMTKLYGDNPLSIGGSGAAMRNLLKDNSGISHAWEANIRYHLTYTYDTKFVPGLMYKIENGNLLPCPPDVDHKILEEFKDTFADDEDLESILTTYSPMFFTEVPEIKRIAVDIEVYTPVLNRIPDASVSQHPVTAIGLSDNEGYDVCFVLKRKELSEGEKSKDFPKELKIKYFDDEAEMLVEAFRIIDTYPLVLTFVGDSFDLKYLYNRAKRLRVDLEKYCPIVMKGNQDPRREQAMLKRGVHVDMYKFFANPSIKIYALSGKYQRENLNTIAEGLLGVSKLDLSDSISALNYFELAHYCWLDANLVLQFTEYENKLLLRLMALLMRISRMSMEEVTRFYISSWIQSLFRQEHRSKGLLIPRRVDIDTMKQPDAQTEAMIGGKAFKGAIVIEPVAGVHFNATVLDFASLYPTIMKEHNISYETLNCPHDECRLASDNKVPETDHWICKKRKGMISQTIGFFRDTRVNWFKPKAKDKSLPEEIRNWYSVVEKALKVFINACLPADEEVIIRTSDGFVHKCRISEIVEDWKDLEILSIQNDISKPNFGTPVFIPIKGFAKTGKSKLLRIALRDGRTLTCTPNHVIPVLRPTHPKSKIIKNPKVYIEEIAAEELQTEEDILVLQQVPLSKSSPKKLFIPDIINTNNLFIGLPRKIYETYSYRTSQKTNDPLVKIVNDFFFYSKVSKKYKAVWDEIPEDKQKIIKDAALGGVKFVVKVGNEVGQWMNSVHPLSKNFFSILGWYIAEGSTGKNRLHIAQYESHNPDNCAEIQSTIKKLGWPLGAYNGRQFVVNSVIIMRLMHSLCGSGAKNKRIPTEILDKKTARILIDSYFKGDGNLVRGNRRYSTASKQLASDLCMILGSLGKYVSIQGPDAVGMFRILETQGWHYRRKGRGPIEFNGTYPVRVKSIETIDAETVYDLETENGWFVTTSGCIVHNSYGVTGAQHFELFCMPAAESVTAFGRDAIIRTKEKSESMGIRVLYGDTDSVFLDNPSLEQQEELVKWSSEVLGIDLEVEKTYKYVALSDRKKNYIGIYKDGRVEVKGLSGKKRNTPDYAQQAFRKMLEVLSRVDDPDGFEAAKEEIREIVNCVIDRLEGKADPYSPEELAFRIQLTKRLSEYPTDTPHVRAAKMLVEETGDPGKVLPGTIIEFIRVKGTGGVMPVELAQGKSFWIDKDTYIDILRSVFDQVLDSVGLDFEEFLGFTTLDKFF
ncbi:MAG: DNA polymerase domain-containing protein [Candidatus Thorarchaeota archaeon]